MKTMKQCVTIIFLLFTCLAKAQDNDSTSNLTLEKCIGFALRNNVDINNADFQSQANGIYYTQAKAQMYPSVNGSVDHSRNSGRTINSFTNEYSTETYTSASYALSASLTIWNGFRIQNYIRKTALDKAAGQMTLQNQKDMTMLTVIGDYLDILNQEDQLNNYKEQLTSTKAQLDKLDSMDKAGAAKPDDIATMLAQLKGYEVSVAQQENAIKTAKIALFNVMNVPLNLSATLDRPKDLTEVQPKSVQSLDDIYNNALNTLPAVKSAELSEQSAYKNVQYQKGAYYPSLSFGASISTNYASSATNSVASGITSDTTGYYTLNGGARNPVYADVENYTTSKIGYFNQLKNNYGTAFGVTLSIPLFNGLQTRSNVKIAKIQYNQAAFNTKTVKNQLKATVGQYVSDVDAALQAWQKQQEQVNAYKELLRVDQIKFDAGALDATGLLVAKTSLEQAEINLILDRYAYIFKSKILSYYQGELKAE